MTRLAVWWTLLPVTAPAPPPGSPGAPGADRGEEFGKTSPIALVVILLLGLATALLIRSMTKQLRKVPASFDPPEGEGAGAAPPDDAAPDGGGRRTLPGRAGGDRTEGPPGTGSP
ncbi:hypothetical protein GCM10023200_50590 [Actinomycetospora chlora]|jgi:hypothetical protein|uniref:Secreted protein n=1 Tax=Actinomycetospora chlora TaxID=663608 RepID=A0ABP9CA68_9PSEU